MSTGVNTARRCEGCEEIGEKWEFQGDYCSTECRYRDRGESIFQQIRSDHTVCASCFGVRKVTEPPTNDWKHENGSGYQVALNSGATLSKVDGKQVLDYTEVGGTRPVAVDSVCGFEY